MSVSSSSLARQYVRYVMLNVLGMLGLSCYILADTYFIANGLGSNGLTALNLAIPVYNCINGLGLMVGMGAATRYSILQARHDPAVTDAVFSRAVQMAMGLGILLLLTGLLWAEPLSLLLGADEVTKQGTTEYLRIILLFAPLFLMNNLVICFVRNDGEPQLAMAAMLAGSFSNVLLDYLFIFPWQMGMMGAALATGVAPFISLCILSSHWWRGRSHFGWRWKLVTLASVRDTASLGVSSLISELSAGLVIVLFNLLILRISGNIGVAAYGIVANLSLVATALFTGLAQGVQPLLSQAFGRGDSVQLQCVFRWAQYTALGGALLLCAVVMGLAWPLQQLFNSEGDPQLAAFAVEGLRLYFLAFPLVGWNIVGTVGFSSSEQPGRAFVISILRGFVCIVPAALGMALWGGMRGIWLSFPVAECVTALVCAWLLWKNPLGRLDNLQRKD
ncbi:MAG: MATE family efflux transporter [Eubacteriales bacterium]|jgi:putative MATE family efflux protein